MIVLDYRDKRPIYEQIVDRMQTLILSGVLEPDEKLPSVRALAVDLSINPNTIQRAYSELEREGFIYSVKGRGNFVRMDEHFLARRQKKLLDEVRMHAAACRDLKIPHKELIRCINAVYGEVSE
ncbi:MAG: GntR family transcriptional regulator [Eubacterium sp.]|nr:GntR family transcriptional regulator [Eubacterium sp.]